LRSDFTPRRFTLSEDDLTTHVIDHRPSVSDLGRRWSSSQWSRNQDAKQSSQYWGMASFSGKAVWQLNPSASKLRLQSATRRSFVYLGVEVQLAGLSLSGLGPRIRPTLPVPTVVRLFGFTAALSDLGTGSHDSP
jgi:hypothetical protein